MLSLCLHLSSFNLYHLISTVDVILFGLDCFINSIISFLHTMIRLCCCVSEDTCSYGLKASQILELGVSEFCSIVPNSHVKFRVCFRVLSQNSQKGRL